MNKSTGPGVLMRLVEPNVAISQDSTQIFPRLPESIVQTTYTATADDAVKPTGLKLYILNDIGPIISSAQHYADDVAANPSLTISWILCRFISGRSPGFSPSSPPSFTHPLPHQPAARSKLVINGSTPRPDKESDYHEWYDVEHGPGLAIVPGWNAMRRYALEKVYGDVEIASFYGFNYYDEESGLGGEIWTKSTKTEWTARIRGNAAKENIRRVWRMEDA
jgi:hypothetical protein